MVAGCNLSRSKRSLGEWVGGWTEGWVRGGLLGAWVGRARDRWAGGACTNGRLNGIKQRASSQCAAAVHQHAFAVLQVGEDAHVMLNGFGTVINALGRRAKPYLPQVSPCLCRAFECPHDAVQAHCWVAYFAGWILAR